MTTSGSLNTNAMSYLSTLYARCILSVQLDTSFQLECFPDTAVSWKDVLSLNPRIDFNH